MSDRGEPLSREIEHTAEVGFEVEADTAEELFRRAGLALFRLMVEPEGVEARSERRESVAADGFEDVLHDWLAKLLLGFVVDGFVAAEIKVDHLSARGIDSRLRGEILDPGRHGFRTGVKTVTWHKLAVTRDGPRWRARVIFDG